MKGLHLLLVLVIGLSLTSCSSFKAKRVGSAESDEKAMEITDEWVAGDTERVIKDILANIKDHRGFKNYLRKHGKRPSLFIAQVQNLTSEAYFPINDINDELLYELSSSGDFKLIDNNARAKILKELTYQHDGMVDPGTAKQIGKQTGADLLIFGNVFMKPKSRKGKTIKEYTVNIRMTDLETTEVVMMARTKISKFSEQSSSGW